MQFESTYDTCHGGVLRISALHSKFRRWASSYSSAHNPGDVTQLQKATRGVPERDTNRIDALNAVTCAQSGQYRRSKMSHACRLARHLLEWLLRLVFILLFRLSWINSGEVSNGEINQDVADYCICDSKSYFSRSQQLGIDILPGTGLFCQPDHIQSLAPPSKESPRAEALCHHTDSMDSRLAIRKFTRIRPKNAR